MDAIDRLTERQKACLRLVGQAYTSKEIGRRLGISPATVDNHVRAALEILQVESRAEAARLLLAREAGQSLTSQPPALADPLRSPPLLSLPDPPQHRWWQRLVPPLGGTRNDLSWESKNAAILRIALFGFVVLMLMTLGIAILLWAFS
ncbi:helix-turn-helix domain-containing protein [Sphingomonas soli]|uniref:helix-turn-helix domain-containing protein n=1 Tax=Sphingomonas soli TaxID=266127 RepID=UPI0008301D7C|nr:helix-turn-helix transcriptional regulator [Sphingomonas soli]